MEGDGSLAEMVKLPKAKKLKKRGVAAAQFGVVAGGTQSPKPGTPQRHSSSNLHSALKQVTAMLPGPGLETHISIVILGMRGEEGEDVDSPVVEVDNDLDTSRYTLSYTTATPNNVSQQWKVELASPCLLAAANVDVTGVACQDRSLSLYSTHTGRLLTARLFLPETCTALRVEARYVLAVLRSAVLSVWDVRGMRSLVRGASFSHLLLPSTTKRGGYVAPDDCLLTRDGQPVLVVGRSCYAFDSDMQSWVEITGVRDMSEIQTPSGGPPPQKRTDEGEERFPLDALQRRVHTGSPCGDSVGLALLQQAGRNTASATTGSTLAYLESQISRSLCLRSPLEYRKWGETYVQFLAKSGMERRLREFCGKFSAPCLGHDGDGPPGGLVLGFSKRELLSGFLDIIAKNPKLQRLYSEFKEALERT